MILFLIFLSLFVDMIQVICVVNFFFFMLIGKEVVIGILYRSDTRLVHFGELDDFSSTYNGSTKLPKTEKTTFVCVPRYIA